MVAIDTVYIHGTIRAVEIDLNSCLVFNTRMASRAVTRRYDAVLRPYGITSAQFALMGQIKRFTGGTLSALAERNGLDRTSLTRNLDVLERAGLIASVNAAKGNGRRCQLTPKGEVLIAELAPIWIEAQAEMRKLLGDAGFDSALKALRQLSRA